MGIPHKQSYVTFSLAGEHFCTSVQYVREVVRPTKFTRLPGAGTEMIGVINLRGKIIPVVDMTHPIRGIRKRDLTRGWILIANSSRGDVGLLVEDVRGVVELPKGGTPPASELLRHHEAVNGLVEVDGRLVAIIDLALFLETTLLTTTTELASTAS